MKVVTVATQKGGVGKTSTAAAIAQAAASLGKKVLAIDLDSQRNLTFTLSADERHKGSYDLLNGEDIKKTIQSTEQGLDVISSSWDLATLRTEKGSIYILQDELKRIEKLYDLVVIDTPPNINVLQYNGIQACDILIIPMITDTYSLQGLYPTLEAARAIQKTNKDMVIGAVITRYEDRSILDRNMEQAIKDGLKENNVVYLGRIRKAVALKEAQTMQQSLYEYAPTSKPATDYMKITHIILKEI